MIRYDSGSGALREGGLTVAWASRASPLDCDGAESVGLLSEFILDEHLPTPNVIVRRVASGNCHAHYMLDTPVHRVLPARSPSRRSLGCLSTYRSRCALTAATTAC